MAASDLCPSPAFTAGERRHGFRIIRVEAIPDIRVTAYEIEHEKTGAKVIHLHCDDRENLYSIGFRTPPGDSTGVPHILEHSVLAGSESFPVKDAFSELQRGTLQTFINAFTYPDKTIYPVASQVKVDFFNLARVYTDLVLRPRLLRETFRQEGHHLEFIDSGGTAGELTVTGIVYNEMKGAYSSPDAILFKALQESLFPDTAYAYDSGGDPEMIPSLTYERFKEFHRLYYSPTNSRFLLYGNIEAEDHLAFLKEMLEGFDRVEVDSTIGRQARWKRPSAVNTFFPIGREETTQRKTTVTAAWMTAENTDGEIALLLEIVAGILVGNAAGPLRKALIDSGLGEDLSPATGLERDFAQIVFAAGLRGTDPDKASPVEELILETLRKCATEGFDRELVEGILHRVEFRGREIVRSHFPYGIVLMGRVYHTWLYGGDPFANLNAPRLIDDIRRKWAREPSLFQEVARAWLLDNPHRLLIVMAPSRTIGQEREAAFHERMASLRESLSPSLEDEIRLTAEQLKQFQVEEDCAEALASLPALRISDIPRAVETIPTERVIISGVPALVHDIFANGIAYLDIAFDVADVPEELQPYLPLLGKFVVNMGAAGLSYDEMAKRIALKTGGLGYQLTAGMAASGGGHWQKIIFRVKALHRNLADAVQIVSEVLSSAELSDENRMLDLIAEAKNQLHAAVIPSGHIFARMTAGAGLSIPSLRDEQWHGRTQLQFVTSIADGFSARKDELTDTISRLGDLVFRRGRMTLNLTADAQGLALLQRAITDFVERIGAGSDVREESRPDLHPTHAGIAIPAQVSYVARVAAAPPYGDPLSASLFVAARRLSNGYLYRHIRVQGGAYGGSAQYDPLSGSFAFLSYRDPHIVETLKVYGDAVEDLTKNRIPEGELRKAVIGAVGAMDRPMDPAQRGYTAMIRELSGLTEGMRQAFRNEIIGMTAEALQQAATRYFAGEKQAFAVAVYAAEDKLLRANETMQPRLVVSPLISTNSDH